MAQVLTDPSDDMTKDHLMVKHPDGRAEKIPIPEGTEVTLRVGRELDNDVVLTDPRSSRHHAEIRRHANALEVKDLGSANGTLINQNRIDPETWVKITPGQTIQMAETTMVWEQALTSQATVAMKRQPVVAPIPSAEPAPVPVPAPAAPSQQPVNSILPWAIGAGVVIALLLLIGLGIILFSGEPAQPEEVAAQPTPAETPAPATEAPAAGRSDDESLILQTPAGGPTDTPTPTGPQLAIPVLEITSLQVSPIIFGASPSTKNAYIFIDVRAQNSGNIPFVFSISNFSLQTRDGQEFKEAGSNTSENYLKQLGAIDRFENLALTPGGSVPGSLVFELEIGAYDLELVFNAPDLEPIVLGLGTIDMARELALAAGTPASALDAVATGTPTVEPTPTLEPTPTPTRPPLIPAPQVVPRSALVGTIAYPVFNGTSYDIYLGEVDGSGSRFYRAQASQPAFSPDGSRIAFHSWDDRSRGLMTMDVTGATGYLVANFIEDQLPTWTADGSEIIFLSRRSGDRKSNLIKVSSTEERTEGVIVGEGEYPTVGPNNQLVFKGWGSTAFGLRVATADLEDVQTVTNVEEDTAPALSPDGERVVFMSRREENWDVYVVNVDGSGLQRLTDDPAQDGLPTWSPDGNAIAFVSDRGGIWAIWVMTPDGKGQSQLFTMEGSADGFVGTDNFASRGWAEERISWTK
jgi:TolB protein